MIEYLVAIVVILIGVVLHLLLKGIKAISHLLITRKLPIAKESIS